MAPQNIDPAATSAVTDTSGTPMHRRMASLQPQTQPHTQRSYQHTLARTRPVAIAPQNGDAAMTNATVRFFTPGMRLSTGV